MVKSVGLWSPCLSLHGFVSTRPYGVPFIKIYKDATFAANMSLIAPFSWVHPDYLCAHSKGWGCRLGKPLLEMLSFSKGGVHLCGCTVNYWSTFRHTSLTSQRLYTLSQCYTGCFFARNSGMVWIIGILTAWEQRSWRPPIPNSSLSS